MGCESNSPKTQIHKNLVTMNDFVMKLKFIFAALFKGSFGKVARTVRAQDYFMIMRDLRSFQNNVLELMAR